MASVVHECHMTIGGKELSTFINWRDTGTEFPLLVLYGGRELTFVSRERNSYSSDSAHVQVRVSDPDRGSTLKLTAVGGRQCGDATCYTIKYASFSMSAASTLPRVSVKAFRGTLRCYAG